MDSTYSSEILDHQSFIENEHVNLEIRNIIRKDYRHYLDKIILNINPRTGWLASLCISCGAAKVYVCGIKNNLAFNKIFANNPSISVLEQNANDLIIPEKLDIIISEDLFYNVLESDILKQVSIAQKFLKDDGFIVPEGCRINIALCSLPSVFQFWDKTSKVSMKSAGNLYRQTVFNRCTKFNVRQSAIASYPQAIAELNFLNLDCDKLGLEKTLMSVCRKEGIVDGICLWQEVCLSGESITMAKFMPGKKCIVIPFPSSLDLELFEPVCFNLSFNKNSDGRIHSISLDTKDIDDISHPEGCDCLMTKCIVLKACHENQAFNKISTEDETGGL